MAGRPSEFTPEIANGIILALRTGVSQEVAAQSQGISRATFYEWMKIGQGRHPTRPQTEEFRDFSDRVEVAKAEAHLMAVGTVRTAIVKGNWQAALAWLKMRYPRDYAERFEHTGPENGPIAIEVAQAIEGLTEDELAGIERFLAEAASGSRSGGAPAAGRRRKGTA